jgi:hypothetical protein
MQFPFKLFYAPGQCLDFFLGALSVRNYLDNPREVFIFSADICLLIIMSIS